MKKVLKLAYKNNEIQSILGKASQNAFMLFWNVNFVWFVLLFYFAFLTLYVSWIFPQLMIIDCISAFQ